jgi:type II secretory pathway pseudopilin PulG
MKNIPTSRLAVKRRTHSDSGFTLVEMLVAVTLVMLMMTMFAQVLQMATDSVGTQQVISENDQKARSLTTVMRADFLSRTMRYPWAFYPSEDPATSPTFKTKQRDGYLYISTNLPDNALDDLIQFTVHSNQLSDFNNNPDYFGRGSFLLDTEAIANGFGGGTLYNNPNQPEADDDEMSPNGTGSSPAAEISYFVRNGNLYRRVVLLREPLDIAGFGSQPISSRDFDLFRGDHNVMDATIPTVNEHLFELSDGTRTNDYWRNFDFSARVPLPPTLGVWAQLLGVNSLNNEPSSGTGSVDSLGNPLYRWGFDMFSARSREHDNTTNAAFIC